MNKNKIIIFLLLGFIFPTAEIYSQQKDLNTARIYFLNNEESEFGKYFHNINSNLLHSPGVPNFILASKNSNVIFGLGGYVMFNCSYDFGGVCNNASFFTADIYVPNKGNPRNKLQMNANSSRIFAKMMIDTKSLGMFTTYVEGDFMGSGNAFRLRQAYVSFVGLTIGQTKSNFVDLRSLAPALDQNLSSASGAQRNPLIKYELSITKTIKSSLSIEYPTYSASYGSENSSAPIIMPDIPFYIEYDTKPVHIRASAILRNMAYKDLIDNDFRSRLGYGFKLSGHAALFPALELLANASYGKGISSYIVDISNSGLALVSKDKSGKMFAPETVALYAGFKIDYTKKLYSGISGGYIRVNLPDYFDGISTKPRDDFYNYGFNVCANLIWKILPSCIWGIEYLYGERVNYSKEKGHSNRVSTIIKYSF